MDNAFDMYEKDNYSPWPAAGAHAAIGRFATPHPDMPRWARGIGHGLSKSNYGLALMYALQGMQGIPARPAEQRLKPDYLDPALLELMQQRGMR